jgi:catechol 2,3-dioxygenase-like lactoylglutathione lyase family enzyme
MINAVHALIYAENAEATRAFFRDVLGLRFVEAHPGWLIFALPPAELGIHPAEDGPGAGPSGRHALYLMCDDIEKTIAELKAKGVEFTRPVSDEGWGLLTTLRIPGGGEIGLYEPRHPVPR